MRFITYTIAAVVAVAAPLAIAQVSGVDTTRSLEDQRAFPDPTLPQADKYIPEVRKKVTNPLAVEEEAESEADTPTAEEVADFIGIDAAPDASVSALEPERAKAVEDAEGVPISLEETDLVSPETGSENAVAQ